MTEMVGRIEEINTFPLAGTQAISHESAVLGLGGFTNDHAWLLYRAGSKGNERISRAQHPRLAQLITWPSHGALHVVHDPTLAVEGFPAWETVIPALGQAAFSTAVEIAEFKDPTPCYDMGDGIAAKFSEFLDSEVRVARKTSEWLSGGGKPPAQRANATLHIGLYETAQALASTVPGGVAGRATDRLRANMIVSGLPAFTDAGWVGGTLLVGKQTVPIGVDRLTKRCGVPSQHPLTGQNLKDLAQAYQSTVKALDDGKPTIGVYGHFAGSGLVEVRRGDTVRFVPKD